MSRLALSLTLSALLHAGILYALFAYKVDAPIELSAQVMTSADFAALNDALAAHHAEQDAQKAAQDARVAQLIAQNTANENQMQDIIRAANHETARTLANQQAAALAALEAAHTQHEANIEAIEAHGTVEQPILGTIEPADTPPVNISLTDGVVNADTALANKVAPERIGAKVTSGTLAGALVAHIKPHWHPPSGNQGARLSAQISIDAQGRILSVTILGAGDTQLRQSLENAIMSASPLTPLVGSGVSNLKVNFVVT